MNPTNGTLSFLKINPTELGIPFVGNVSPSSGSTNISVDIPVTPGRNGLQPGLSLSYGSNAGNSPFGSGWNLQGVPSVGLSLKNGYPKYDGSDTFSFGGQDLIPWLEQSGTQWLPRTDENDGYYITYFRSKLDATYTRFEKWSNKLTQEVHWRVHDRNNQVMVFGLATDQSTKIVDPNRPNKIFQWLLDALYDNKGNVVKYEYISENYLHVDTSSSFERNRVFHEAENAQKYLKRILYANTTPVFPNEHPLPTIDWLFEVVFDYGDQEVQDLIPRYTLNVDGWPVRTDPFSSYVAGFEQRTYRLCQRILVFHHMDELGNHPTLVGSTDFIYNPDPSGTTLTEVHYTGFRREITGDFDKKSMPPLLFEYTTPSLANSFLPIPQQSANNTPMGLTSSNYKWVDLYGEGLPGILYESNDIWYFKPNLGGGKLGQQHKVSEKPSAQYGSYALSDFDHDGNLNLVVMQGRESGYYQYNRDLQSWDTFQPFISAPHVRQMDTNTQLIDITGDGQADIITTEEDRLVWYPSKGKEGFDKAVQISKSVSNGVSRAPTIGAHPMLDYFFIDMNGSGLPDQVHISNGKLEYWPNLGNGKFGAGIVMENAPQLDFDFELDVSKIRLVDLTGSGTSDLIYLGRGEIKYWINASGNKFLEGETISGLPYIDNISTAQILDFLGNGTPCLVWSSALSIHSDSSIHYLQLTNGIKPRLLTHVQNSMGMETRFHYGYSATHYLRDKASGRPWISRLPSHHIVVDRIETIDHIANTRLENLFEYHDGFFDGINRTFQGFCLVDQYDSDLYQGTSGIPESQFTDPVCLRTWFHNGVPGWQKERAKSYYVHDTFGSELKDFQIESINDLGPEEYFDAVRSVAGQVIRTEVYGLTASGNRKEHPFQVTHANYLIRRIQPKNADQDASFSVFPKENLEIVFEERPDDPLITHSFNLNIDHYGVAKHKVALAYPRIHPDAHREQGQFHIQGTEINVLHFENRDRYQLGIPMETKSFEFRRQPPPSSNQLFRYEIIAQLLEETINEAIFFDAEFNTASQAKLISWTQHYYWNDAQTNMLPFESFGRNLLLHHSETACFHDEFLSHALGDKLEPDMLSNSHYLFHDDHWWQPSSIIHYFDRSGYFLPISETQPDGGRAEYVYDDHNLTLTGTTIILLDDSGEVARSSTSALIDYHALAPYQIEDANRNISEVVYDPLGVIKRASTHGELLSDSGRLEPFGHDLLNNYIAPEEVDFTRILANPSLYLQGSGSFFYYELDTWQNDRLPLRSISLAREQWLHDGSGNELIDSTYQLQVHYSDGFARTIQTKSLVEPGNDTIQYDIGNLVLGTDGEPLLGPSDGTRWHVSGHVVFNNKQQPVQQFEPYFSSIVEFENDELLQNFGYSASIEYDAMGREKLVVLPDGSRTGSIMAPWTTEQYDANDLVEGSLYQLRIEASHPIESPERIALEKSLKHKNTPVISHQDGLGRVFLTEEADENGNIKRNRLVYDGLGEPKEIIDPRELTAFTYLRDMQGRTFQETSMDAGPKWQFINALNQPVHLWDGRDTHQQFIYDHWGRIVEKHVDSTLLGMNHMTEHFIYAETASLTNPWQRNLNGQLIEHYDQAGVTRAHKYDLAGNLLNKERQLLEDYDQIPNWLSSVAPNWMSGSAFETKVTYDAVNRPLEQHLPDGTTRHYRYRLSGSIDQLLLTTADGRMTEQPIIAGSDFNAKGQRKELVLGNGIVQQFTYNSLNSRLQLKNSFRRETPAHPSKHYQHINYTYDAVGNITHLIDTAEPNDILLYDEPRIHQYEYDAFYQLIESEGRTHEAMERTDYSKGVETTRFLKGTRHISLRNMHLIRAYTRSYSYDLNGNMKSLVHSSGKRPNEVYRWRRDLWISENSNRSMELKDLNGISLSESVAESRFDENGNLDYLPHLRQVNWNYLNQLASAVLIERPGDDDAEFYVYGGDGQRVRKITQRFNGTSLVITEKIYLDGCEIKRVRQGTNLLLERFTSHLSDGNERVALMHQWTRDTENTETLNIDEKKIHYQLSDHLGSSAFELDEMGEIINYEEYFPFGGSAFIFANELKDVDLKDYRYSGKERDDATNLYYYGFRYYAPWLCRWLNPDPIGPEDGLNVFQFVHNNPVNEVDLNGLQSSEVINAQRHWTSTTRTPTEGGAENLQVSDHTFNSRSEEGAFIRNWIREHPEGTVVYNGVQYAANSGLLPVILDGGLTMTAQEVMDLVTGGNDQDVENEDNNSAQEGETGSGNSGEEGSGTIEGENEENTGTNGTPNGEGTNEGNGDGTQRRRRRRTNGQDNGHSNGRPGGTGTRSVDPRERVPGVPVGENPPGVDATPQLGSTDPAAVLQGDPNGSLTGPEAVNSELPVGPDNPDGYEEGTLGGNPDGRPQEELEWYHWVAIVAVVLVIALITAGMAASIIGSLSLTLAAAEGAAAISIGLSAEALAIVGAGVGVVGGLASDAATQGLTIGFGAQSEFDWGQFAFSGVTGAFTGGAGGYFSGGASTAARQLTLGSFARSSATRFGMGAAEGGGMELLRQGVMGEDLNLSGVGLNALIGGGANAAMGGGIDLWQSRRAATSVRTRSRLLADNSDPQLDPINMTDRELRSTLGRDDTGRETLQFLREEGIQVRQMPDDAMIERTIGPDGSTPRSALGLWVAKTDEIWVNSSRHNSAVGVADTVVHEGVHARVSRRLGEIPNTQLEEVIAELATIRSGPLTPARVQGIIDQVKTLYGSHPATPDSFIRTRGMIDIVRKHYQQLIPFWGQIRRGLR